MEHFTADQCQATAKQYLQLSSATFRKRLFFLHQGLPLSDPAFIQLQSQQINLGDISNEYALKASALTLDGAEQAATKISDSLDNANAAMNTLKTIDNAVAIASNAIDLSVAIYSANLDQIAAAAKTLAEAATVRSLA